MNALREWKWIIVLVLFLMGCALSWTIGRGLGGVADVGIFSALINVLAIPFLVGSLFLSLRLRDRIGGIDWPKMRDAITDDPFAAAIYAGAWVIGVSVIIASL